MFEYCEDSAEIYRNKLENELRIFGDSYISSLGTMSIKSEGLLPQIISKVYCHLSYKTLVAYLEENSIRDYKDLFASYQSMQSDSEYNPSDISIHSLIAAKYAVQI